MKFGVTVEAVIALGGITNSPDAPLLLEELGVAIYGSQPTDVPPDEPEELLVEPPLELELLELLLDDELLLDVLPPLEDELLLEELLLELELLELLLELLELLLLLLLLYPPPPPR